MLWRHYIFQLAGFETDNNTIDFIPEQATSAEEQRWPKYFHKAMELPSNVLYSKSADVASFLREGITRPAHVPSVGQVKATLRKLTSRKATRSDKIAAW